MNNNEVKRNKMSLLPWWLLKIYETRFVPAKQTQLPCAYLQEKCPLWKQQQKTQPNKQKNQKNNKPKNNKTKPTHPEKFASTYKHILKHAVRNKQSSEQGTK